MSWFRIVGVDPGLAHLGWCVYDVGAKQVLEIDSADVCDENGATIPQIAATIDSQIADAASRHESTTIALEDYTWRAPKSVGGRQITFGLDMCRLIGHLHERLLARDYNVHLVRPQDSKRNQPSGALAKKLGIPGRNDHQRSAFYAAQWLAGTLRLAGGVA